MPFGIGKLAAGGGNSVLSDAVFVLDAGNIDSYNGSSIYWNNIVQSPADGASSTEYNFYRGLTSGSESSDPTFNGVAGNDSSNEYFSFNGNQYFTIPANTDFVNGLHLNDTEFTFVCFIDVPTIVNGMGFFGTRKSTSNRGIWFFMGGGGVPEFRYGNASTVYNAPSQRIFSSKKYMVALSYSELTGAGIIYITDGAATSSDTFTQTYSAVSGDAQSLMQIMAVGENFLPAESGAKVYLAAMFNKSLSVSRLDNIFQAYKYKIGLS